MIRLNYVAENCRRDIFVVNNSEETLFHTIDNIKYFYERDDSE